MPAKKKTTDTKAMEKPVEVKEEKEESAVKVYSAKQDKAQNKKEEVKFITILHTVNSVPKRKSPSISPSDMRGQLDAHSSYIVTSKVENVVGTFYQLDIGGYVYDDGVNVKISKARA